MSHNHFQNMDTDELDSSDTLQSGMSVHSGWGVTRRTAGPNSDSESSEESSVSDEGGEDDVADENEETDGNHERNEDGEMDENGTVDEGSAHRVLRNPEGLSVAEAFRRFSMAQRLLNSRNNTSPPLTPGARLLHHLARSFIDPVRGNPTSNSGTPYTGGIYNTSPVSLTTSDLITNVAITDLNHDDRNCVICLEPFHEGEVPNNATQNSEASSSTSKGETAVRLRACNHVFGLACLQKHINQGHRSNFLCPLCRAPIPRGTTLQTGVAWLTRIFASSREAWIFCWQQEALYASSNASAFSSIS